MRSAPFLLERIAAILKDSTILWYSNSFLILCIHNFARHKKAKNENITSYIKP